MIVKDKAVIDKVPGNFVLRSAREYGWYRGVYSAFVPNLDVGAFLSIIVGEG
jgi:hypothetical protein